MARGKRAIMTLWGDRFGLIGPRQPLSVEIDDEGPSVYVRVRDALVQYTREIAEEVIADYDAEGRLVGFEVIGALSGRKHGVQIPDLFDVTTRSVAKASSTSWELEGTAA